ncbi:MAG TPA: D-arabinono-1,4-lactone oxidase [Solirubrobacteraceae bacterium]|nr:D-arabinono-1,4-lactone oxidase [Solirubrobacteraceae bacterium]
MSEPSDRHQPAGAPASRGGEWRNWAGDQRCRPAVVETPGSIEQISEAIARAAAHDRRVRVAGAGHSFSDIALTDGSQLRLDRLTRVLDVDRATGLVRVQGGITIRELNLRLAEHGLAMENLGDVDAQTLAGAISTATHGTGARLPNISAQVAELTLVLADGSTLLCAAPRDGGTGREPLDPGTGPLGAATERHDTRTAPLGADLLRAARVSLGALGVIAEVTLRCVPAFTLRGVDTPKPLHDTLARFEELALDADHFELFVFPHAGVALTRTNNRTDDPPRPRGRISAYANDILLTNHVFALFCRAGRRFPKRIPQINRLVTRLAGASTRMDRSDRIFASPRLVRFTEMEYSLPRHVIPEAVRRVMALVPERGFAVPFPIEIRTVAPDDALLSTAFGRDSGFVAVHMFEGMPFEPYFRAVEAVMDEFGGRPHWGKRHFQTAATLRPRYPEWDRFQAIRARLDPHGRFANDWTDRILGPVDG